MKSEQNVQPTSEGKVIFVCDVLCDDNRHANTDARVLDLTDRDLGIFYVVSRQVVSVADSASALRVVNLTLKACKGIKAYAAGQLVALNTDLFDQDVLCMYANGNSFGLLTLSRQAD